MERDNTTGRLTGRDLAGRAALLAVGVGTAMGAGAGLAAAAPLEDGVKLSPTGPSMSQAPETADLAGALGGLAQAPSLGLVGGESGTAVPQPSDLGTVSGDQLAGLGSSDQLSGLGSDASMAGQGATDAGATDGAGSSGTVDGGDAGAGTVGGSTSGSEGSDYTASYGG